jgi:hypothetical protein
MNNQWESPMCGTLRITNPKTLEKWIQNGSYQKELDNGYVYGIGCGRFRTEPCQCVKCRKAGPNNPRQIVINRHYKPKK